MRTLALSGWGQPFDALSVIAPEAAHADYGCYDNLDAALAHIAELAVACERVIGWSLGGQLAVRAIGLGLINPKKLVLIATPFSLVGDGEGGTMGRDTYGKFRQNFADNPARALKKGYALIAHGDANTVQVAAFLAKHNREEVLTRHWLYWLDALDGFNAAANDLSRFPDTLLVQGTNDAVVGAAQAERYKQALPQATLALWEGCGHAPHWHNPKALMELIEDHV